MYRVHEDRFLLLGVGISAFFIIAWLYLCATHIGKDAAIAVSVIDTAVVLGFSAVLSSRKVELPIGQAQVIFVMLAVALVCVVAIAGSAQAAVVVLFWLATGASLYVVVHDPDMPGLRWDILTAWAVGLALMCCEKAIFDAFIPAFPLELDTQSYVSWAQAFQQAMEGRLVDAEAFRLNGMLNSGNESWDPNGPFSFADAIGTRHTLYSILLAVLFTAGLHLDGVQFVQVGLIAAGAAAWYAVVLRLSGSRLVAVGMLALVLVDSHGTAAALTLWREAVVLFLFPLFILGCLRLMDRPSIGPAVLLVVLTGTALSVSRFFLLLLLLGLVVGVGGWQTWFDGNRRRLTALVMVSALTLVGSAIAYDPVLTRFSFGRILDTVSAPVVEAGRSILGPEVTEKSIKEWQSELKHDPPTAIINALTRTFFNPNPNWLRDSGGAAAAPFISSPENTLLYPAMFVFIPSTPFFLVGMVFWRKSARPTPGVLLLFLIVVAMAIGYATVFGGFSNRQRIQVVPIFYFFVMQGIVVSSNIFRKLVSEVIHERW